MSITSDLEHNKESISSMNITLGYLTKANLNNIFTIFSPSPMYLLVRELADIEKKVEFDSQAIALPIIVFPVPGGPKSRRP